MSQEKTEGVVLRGVDFSESSRIVTMLTPDRGRVACMAKGARRKNSTLGPVLDTYSRIELVYYWKDGREVQILAEATLLDGFSSVKRDIERSLHAAVPLEIACKVAQANEPSEALYRALVRGLESLSEWRGNVANHACWQVVQLMCAAGFAPALPETGPPKGPVGFAFGHGIAAPGERADRRLSEAGCTALCAMATSNAECPDMADEPELLDLLCHYATRQLETSLRSIRVLRETLG